MQCLSFSLLAAVSTTTPDPLEERLNARRASLRLRRARHLSKMRETLQAEGLPAEMLLASGSESPAPTETQPQAAIELPPVEQQQPVKATKRKFGEILREFVSEPEQSTSQPGKPCWCFCVQRCVSLGKFRNPSYLGACHSAAEPFYQGVLPVVTFFAIPILLVRTT